MSESQLLFKIPGRLINPVGPGLLILNGFAPNIPRVLQIPGPAGLIATGFNPSLILSNGGAAPVTKYHNSNLPGANAAGCVWEDNFSRGWGYKYNYDRAVALFGGWSTSAATAVTADCAGTIYSNTSIPEGSGANTVVAFNKRGSQYWFNHGTQPQPEGADFMFDHDLEQTCDELYVYWEEYYFPGYLFGAEKRMDFNRLGGGGIIFGNVHNNLGAGSASSTASWAWQGTGGPSYTGLYTLNSGRIYAHQVFCKLNTSNGILKMWSDDLGANGTTIPSGGNPTIRLSRTDYPFIPATGGSQLCGNLWNESWANAASVGQGLRGNIRVMKTTGTGGNTPMLIAA